MWADWTLSTRSAISTGCAGITFITFGTSYTLDALLAFGAVNPVGTVRASCASVSFVTFDSSDTLLTGIPFVTL